MNPYRLLKRGVKIYGAQIGTLSNYKLVFNKVAFAGYGYANIIEDKKNYVEGIVYEIDKDSLNRLDLYEGYPNHYNRHTLRIITENNQHILSEVYIANKSMTKNNLKPSGDYLNNLVVGSRYLSTKYQKFIRSFAK